ncbi:hypothetical protein ACEXQD_05470 [Herbiconiux sp. P15]|uniref:hypothetical protein n=1 Tax=Herbiconiux liukaitaii TaxID=3342799 RepID=UPI0035BA9700
MTDATPNEQSEPIMAGSDEASLTQKAEGILAQVKADAPGASGADLAALLRQRFAEVELDVSDTEIARLAAWEAGES